MSAAQPCARWRTLASAPLCRSSVRARIVAASLVPVRVRSGAGNADGLALSACASSCPRLRSNLAENFLTGTPYPEFSRLKNLVIL